MKNIFLTENQFKYILKKLGQGCHYHKPSTNDENSVSWLETSITHLPVEIGIMFEGCRGKDEFPIIYFKNKDGNIGQITVSYSPKCVGPISLANNFI